MKSEYLFRLAALLTVTFFVDAERISEVNPSFSALTSKKKYQLPFMTAGRSVVMQKIGQPIVAPSTSAANAPVSSLSSADSLSSEENQPLLAQLKKPSKPIGTRSKQFTQTTATEQQKPIQSSGTCSADLYTPRSEFEKIYVLGDLHGDYSSTVLLLQTAKLVDSSLKWIGGRSRLVQLGDISHRGPFEKAIFDLFAELKVQAKQAGGEVHLLFGNHELLSLCNSHTYASSESLAINYASSTKSRKLAWGPTEPLGKWIRENLEVLVILDNRFVFVHGGLDATTAASPKTLKDALIYLVDSGHCDRKYDRYRLQSSQGVLWTRFFSDRRTDDCEVCSTLVSSLEALSQATGGVLSHPKPVVFVGHTVTNSLKIETRCHFNDIKEIFGGVSVMNGYQYIQLDTGISEWMEGQPIILEISQEGERLIFTEIQPTRVAAHVGNEAVFRRFMALNR